MYIPEHFRENDLAALHTFIQQNLFATIITCQDAIPLASHIPLILDQEQGSYGTLLGHFALANQHWRAFDGVREALIIFQGPHTYITPSWYEDPAKSVPTWNYAAVHAYGVPRIIEDKEALLNVLMAQVQTYEAGFEKPWELARDAEYVQKLLHGTVGFTMPIERIEGKFKLSQNRPVHDQKRVVAALKDQSDAVCTGVAALMQKRL